ncbi:MAG: hypothetical protein QME90_19350, partial [Thermodesulfobacteriota bacterium]|nr:hypothetical protein [Thermodesulfobacteriota bacterium]
MIDLQKGWPHGLQGLLLMAASLGLMPGQGLRGGGGAIFADAGVGWWIDFPVETEVIMDSGHLREVKEIEIAHLALR